MGCTGGRVQDEDTRLVPNVLRTERLTRGITRDHVPSRPPCQSVGSSGLPPALCPFPKGCSEVMLWKPEEGHPSIGDSVSRSRLFTKWEGTHWVRGNKEVFLQTGPWPLPLTRISAFPAGFFLLKVKSNWAGRGLPSWPCKPSGWEQIRHCGAQVWGRTNKAALESKPLMVLVLYLEKVVARLKFDTIVRKQRFEDCQLLGSSCSHHRANLSSYIGADFQPRLVKEQDYSGFLFFHDALYLYSNPDPLLNLIFCECCWVWFWSFPSGDVGTVRVDALIIIHMHKMHDIAKENCLSSKDPKLMQN